MKRELLVPLLLIVGISMLVMPAAAQNGEVVLPFAMESDGYGKIKVDEKWGFWPIYCRGNADFDYYTCVCSMSTWANLDVYGRRC